MILSQNDLHDLHLAIVDQELDTMTSSNPRINLTYRELHGLVAMVITPKFLPVLEQHRPGSMIQLQILLNTWRKRQAEIRL